MVDTEFEVYIGVIEEIIDNRDYEIFKLGSPEDEFIRALARIYLEYREKVK